MTDTFAAAAGDPGPNGPLRLDVWLDVTCPWCHIGRSRLARALEIVGDPGAVTVVYRAFELDPELPAGTGRTKLAALAERKNISLDAARRMYAQISAVADAEGVDFRPETVLAANTFDAHRLIRLAGPGTDRADRVLGAVLAAHFADGAAIDDHTVLSDIGAAAGMDRAAVLADLAGSPAGVEAGRQVRADELAAARSRITGVPFYLAGGRLALSGAQPPERLAELLTAARADA